MKVRLLAGSLLAAPALLVATATNGHAATTQGTVAFAGRLTITPSAPGSANVCFDATVSCADSIGTAVGIANSKSVTGMVGSFAYDGACTAGAAYALVSRGSLDVELRTGPELPLPLPAPVPVTTTWQRYGLVAVFTGSSQTVTGVAVMAPAPHKTYAPLCGSPVDLVVTGALAFA